MIRLLIVIGVQFSYYTNIREGSSGLKFSDGGTFSASAFTCGMVYV